MLPSSVKIETYHGDHEVPVESIGSTEVPKHDPRQYAGGTSRLFNRDAWDGFSADMVEQHLKEWTVPADAERVRDEVEAALEEGIPDQRKKMLRNQDFGMLDDRFIDDIAIGEEVERPFMRWTNRKAGETRVAICLDGTVAAYQGHQLLRSRMIVAAGLAAALEMLDYEVSIVSANLQHAGTDNKPRRDPGKSHVFTTVVKEEHEPFCTSAFAHFANTGLRRLMVCWAMQKNGFCAQLTDREWRDLTGADLFIYIGTGAGRHNVNQEGLPRGAKLGPQGEDVIYLAVNEMRDVDPAIGKLCAFFDAQFA